MGGRDALLSYRRNVLMAKIKHESSWLDFLHQQWWSFLSVLPFWPQSALWLPQYSCPLTLCQDLLLTIQACSLAVQMKNWEPLAFGIWTLIPLTYLGHYAVSFPLCFCIFLIGGFLLLQERVWWNKSLWKQTVPPVLRKVDQKQMGNHQAVKLS